ncbi:MAG: hypothetical protein HPY83_14125 [Anaerolineae bacterium]|nr:hypothetical protein [Anaerolineae bacterium]
MQVRILRLEPMRVAYSHAVGAEPEKASWEIMEKWAKAKGLLDGTRPYRIFGHNNPNPSGGDPIYGYDFLLTVDEEVEPEGEIGVKRLAGGLYAATLIPLGTGDGSHISDAWMELHQWVEASAFRRGSHQWLEEQLTVTAADGSQELLLDLYYPLEG